MYVLLTVLATIVLLGFIRIRLVVQYSEAGFDGFLRVFPVKIKFSAKNKKTESAKKAATCKNPEKKPGSLKLFKDMTAPALKSIKKLIRKIRIRNLIADIKVAGRDAFSTAMMYGGTAASIGVLLPILDSNLKIKKKTISVCADFEASESVIYFYADLSINIWQAIAVALYFIYLYLKKIIYKNKKQKGIE